MNNLFLGCAAIAVVVLVEFFYPGQALYQYGWFNALLAGGFVLCAVRAAAVARSERPVAAAVALAIAGTAMLAIAGVANGLFAPAPQMSIGSPGASVRVDDLRGSLSFPLSATDPVIRLDRGGSITEIPSSGSRVAGAFVLSQVPRDVLAVDVSDARGAHLTVTQPSGSAFLSPVLTLPTEQAIAGLSLPFDSFAIPAEHRIVKVALFDARHAAMLKAVDTGGRSAALFAIDDEEGRPVAGGIGIGVDGQSITLAGLRFKALVLRYPAVSIVPLPLPFLVLLGVLCLVGGAWWSVILRRRLDAGPTNV